MNTLIVNKQGIISYTAGTAYGGYTFGDTNSVEDAYLEGKKDGAKDIKIELIKRGNALFQLAFKKAEEITYELIEAADKNEIKIYEFHLKVENWDCLKSLIIVDMKDFADDKIETLYKAANEMSDKVNNETFHWDYSITYASENFNVGKILTDGYTNFYEHIPRPR